MRCEVRLRTRFGDVRPAGEGQAALLDVTPRIKFDRAEVPRPLNAALVVVSESEAYKIGRTRPPEDEWVEAEVSQMNEAEAGQLWQPEWAALLA